MNFPQKIYSSKLKNLGWLCLSAAFVICGVWMGGFWGWSCAIFFGLGLIVFTLQTLPNSSYLVLDERGFIVRSMFRENAYEWKDCGPFSIQNLGGNRFVVFKFSPEHNGGRLLKKVSSLDIGAIPGSYSLNLEELASKMNAARSAALELESMAGNNL